MKQTDTVTETPDQYLDYLTVGIDRVKPKALQPWLRWSLANRLCDRYPCMNHETAVLAVINWASKGANCATDGQKEKHDCDYK